MNPPTSKRVIRRSVVEAEAREVYNEIFAQCTVPEKPKRLQNKDVGRPPVRRSIIVRALQLPETEEEPTPTKVDRPETVCSSKGDTIISTSTPHHTKSHHLFRDFSVVLSPISAEKQSQKGAEVPDVEVENQRNEADTRKYNTRGSKLSENSHNTQTRRSTRSTRSVKEISTIDKAIESKPYIPETKSRTSNPEESKIEEDIPKEDVQKSSKKLTKIPIRTKSQERQLANRRSRSESRKSGGNKTQYDKIVSRSISARHIPDIITISSTINSPVSQSSLRVNGTIEPGKEKENTPKDNIEIREILTYSKKDSQIIKKNVVERDKSETTVEKDNMLKVDNTNIHEEVRPEAEKGTGFLPDNPIAPVKDASNHFSLNMEHDTEDDINKVSVKKNRKTNKRANNKVSEVEDKSQTAKEIVDIHAINNTKKIGKDPIKRQVKGKKTKERVCLSTQTSNSEVVPETKNASTHISAATIETHIETELTKTVAQQTQCDAGTSPIRNVTENNYIERNTLPPKTPGNMILSIADRLARLTSHKEVQTSLNKGSPEKVNLRTSPIKYNRRQVGNVSTQTVADCGAQTSFEGCFNSKSHVGLLQTTKRTSAPQNFNHDSKGTSYGSMDSSSTSVLIKSLVDKNFFQTVTDDYEFPPNFSDSECEVAVTSNDGHWRLDCELPATSGYDSAFKLGFLRSAREIEESRGNFEKNDEFDADMSSLSEEITLTEQQINKRLEAKRSVKFKDIARELKTQKQLERESISKEKVHFFLEHLRLSSEMNTPKDAMENNSPTRSLRKKRTIQDSVKIARSKKLKRQEINRTYSTSDEVDERDNSELIGLRRSPRRAKVKQAAKPNKLLSEQNRTVIQSLGTSLNQDIVDAPTTTEVDKRGSRKKLFFEDSDEVSSSNSEPPPVQETIEKRTSHVDDDVFKVPSARVPKPRSKHKEDHTDENSDSNKENRPAKDNQAQVNEIEVLGNLSEPQRSSPVESNRDRTDNNMDQGDLRNNNSPLVNKHVAKELPSKASTKKRTKTVVPPKERPKRERRPMGTMFKDELCFVPRTALEKQIFGTNSKSIELVMFSAPSYIMSGESKKDKVFARPKTPPNTSESSPQKMASIKVTSSTRIKKGKTTVRKSKKNVRESQENSEKLQSVIEKDKEIPEDFNQEDNIQEMIVSSSSKTTARKRSKRTSSKHQQNSHDEAPLSENPPPIEQVNKVPSTRSKKNTLQEQNRTGRSFENKVPYTQNELAAPISPLREAENLDVLKETNDITVSTKKTGGRAPKKRTAKNQKGPGRSTRKTELVQAGSDKQETTNCNLEQPQIQEPPAKRTRSHKAHQPSSESGIEALAQNNIEDQRFDTLRNDGGTNSDNPEAASFLIESAACGSLPIDNPLSSEEDRPREPHGSPNNIRNTMSPSSKSVVGGQLREKDSGFDTRTSYSLIPNGSHKKIPDDNRRLLPTPRTESASAAGSGCPGSERASCRLITGVGEINLSILKDVTVGDDITFNYDGKMVTYKWIMSESDSEYNKINKYSTLKCFKTVDGTASSGFLKIPVGNKKPLEVSHSYHLMFCVLEGTAAVQLINRKYVAQPHDTFTVPEGFIYSIENISDVALHLYYTRTKKA